MADSCETVVSSAVTSVVPHGPTKVSETSCQEDADTSGSTGDKHRWQNDVLVHPEMLDPILAEDSTYTKLAPSLDGILNDLSEGASHHDYLVALLIVLLAESGFYTSSINNDCPKRSRLRSLRIPKDWKKEGTNSYEMKFQLDEPANVQCKLVVVPLGDTLIINFIPFIKYKSIHTISVQTLKYVNPYSSDRYGRYMNIKAISHRVKDSLCTPVRSNILHMIGLMGPSLQALPTEVKLRILGMLDVRSLLKMSECCSEFHELCSEPHLWKDLLFKDFPEYRYQGITDSKKCYRLKYQKHKNPGFFRRRTHRML